MAGAGKVLLSGGYLILDRANSGIVVPTTTAQIYVDTEIDESLPRTDTGKCRVNVISRQLGQTLAYDVEVDSSGEVTVTSVYADTKF